MANITATEANTIADDYNDNSEYNSVQLLIQAAAAEGKYSIEINIDISQDTITLLENASFVVTKLVRIYAWNPYCIVSWE